MELLKRQKQKKGERRGGPRPPPLCTSLYPPFVSPLSTVPPFIVSVTSAAPLAVVMFSLPSSSIMRCRWRWWSCHVIISYLFENACPTLVLPSIYAHSRRCDFKLKALCHNRSQQETSDWPIGPRVCSFDFFFDFFIFNRNYSQAPTRPTGQKCTICSLEDMFYYWSHRSMQTHSFNLWSPSRGGANPGPQLGWYHGHGAAEWERAERQLRGKSRPALGVPNVQMPSENITQTIFNLDCIFTSSSNSDQLW